MDEFIGHEDVLNLFKPPNGWTYGKSPLADKFSKSDVDLDEFVLKQDEAFVMANESTLSPITYKHKRWEKYIKINKS